MKLFLTSILFSFLLIGCGAPKTEFIHAKLPDIPKKPEMSEYKLNLIEINSNKFYSLTVEDARKLSENWIKYKMWAETNYELLKHIKEDIEKVEK